MLVVIAQGADVIAQGADSEPVFRLGPSPPVGG
jgi:hypothetical protein